MITAKEATELTSTENIVKNYMIDVDSSVKHAIEGGRKSAALSWHDLPEIVVAQLTIKLTELGFEIKPIKREHFTYANYTINWK
jgi:hypothetical protein